MSIDFTGHSALSIPETQRRLAFIRSSHVEWFDEILQLTNARALGPFGEEIAIEFGIQAECNFSLFVRNKEKMAVHGEAIEFIYQVFGTDNLRITYAMDSIREPIASYAKMDIP